MVYCGNVVIMKEIFGVVLNSEICFYKNRFFFVCGEIKGGKVLLKE